MALKVGTEDKKKVIVVAVLGVAVLVLLVRMLIQIFGGSSAEPAQPSTAASRPASSTGSTKTAAKAASITNLDPTLHPELMAGAESLEYSGRGRNIFSMTSAPVVMEAVKGPIRPVAPIPTGPVGPPPPPPIDLKFFGYSAQGANRKAFLLHGDDVFIASEGDVVDHHFKVLKINPFSLQVTDLLYSNTQTLPLIQN